MGPMAPRGLGPIKQKVVDHHHPDHDHHHHGHDHDHDDPGPGAQAGTQQKSAGGPAWAVMMITIRMMMT